MNEKATSVKQQRLMAMAYAYKKGTLDTEGMDDDFLEKIKGMADSMTLKQLKDFASTKHDELKDSLMTFEQFRNSISKIK